MTVSFFTPLPNKHSLCVVHLSVLTSVTPVSVLSKPPLISEVMGSSLFPRNVLGDGVAGTLVIFMTVEENKNIRSVVASDCVRVRDIHASLGYRNQMLGVWDFISGYLHN